MGESFFLGDIELKDKKPKKKFAIVHILLYDIPQIAALFFIISALINNEKYFASLILILCLTLFNFIWTIIKLFINKYSKT